MVILEAGAPILQKMRVLSHAEVATGHAMRGTTAEPFGAGEVHRLKPQTPRPVHGSETIGRTPHILLHSCATICGWKGLVAAMNENEMWVEGLSVGLVIPRTEEYSAKVKELFEAGLIKAEQIEDCISGHLIWVCNGLSNEAKNAIYQRRAKEANAQLQAQLRAISAPFLNMPVPIPPELALQAARIKRDLEKALAEFKLF